ncbi:MAG: histidine kinase, partial [Bacteroidales bacterium]|nr:histidine kinase [Bacteroidales bacterium]
FIENAFKHGITYRKESVLDTSLRMEGGRILFSCYNTKNDTANDQHGGVGLANVRRRLDIFYKDDYVLDVDEDELSYRIGLSLPSEPALKMDRKN